MHLTSPEILVNTGMNKICEKSLQPGNGQLSKVENQVATNVMKEDSAELGIRHDGGLGAL